MVDVLCGVLSGSAFGPDVDNLRRAAKPGETVAPRVGHFFLAIDIARFMPVGAFRDRLAALFSTIKASKKARDRMTIYVHGEKEQERALLHERSGIPIAENVLAALNTIAAGCGLPGPRTVAERLRPQASADRGEVDAS
jgi:LDH2 family malate/lactate/ureidoglycolate dehydrogenase